MRARGPGALGTSDPAVPLVWCQTRPWRAGKSAFLASNAPGVPSGLAFEDDHGNQALRSRLVLPKCRPDAGHLFVKKAVALGSAVDHSSASFELLSPVGAGHFDLDLRVCLDVSEPRRVLGSSAFGRDDYVVVAVAAIDQRSRDGLAALGSTGGQQQHVVCTHADPTPLIGLKFSDRFLIERSC